MTDSSARPAYNLTQSNRIYPFLHVNTLRHFSFLLRLHTQASFSSHRPPMQQQRPFFFVCLPTRERQVGNKHALKSFISQQPLKSLAGAAGPGVVYICLQHQPTLIEASWLTTLLMTVVKMRTGRISFPTVQRSCSKIGLLKFATTLIQPSHPLGLHRLLSRTTRPRASRARITTHTVIDSPQSRVAENDVPTMSLRPMKTLITIMGTDLFCRIYPWVTHRVQEANRPTCRTLIMSALRLPIRHRTRTTFSLLFRNNNITTIGYHPKHWWVRPLLIRALNNTCRKSTVAS